MTWRVDKIKLVGIPILSLKGQSDTLTFNGYATLPFNIHGVKDLSRHFPVTKTPAQLYKAISDRRFTVIYMRDNGKISNMIKI